MENIAPMVYGDSQISYGKYCTDGIWG